MALPRLQPLVVAWATLLAACAAVVGAEDAPGKLYIHDEDGMVALGTKLEILRDPSGKLTIEDVLSSAHAGAFTPSRRDVPTLGFTSDAIWVRLSLAAETERPEHYMIELATARMDHFDWYVVDDGKVLQRVAHGIDDLEPGARRASRFPLLSLTLRRGQTMTVYARAQSDTSVWLPLTGSTPATHLEHALRRDWLDFLLFGICIAMSLISLSLGAIFRRRLFSLAALLPPCFLLHQFTFSGHYLMIDWAWPGWVGRQGLHLVVSVFCAGLILFVREFLAGQQAPAGRKPALRLAMGLVALATACILALPYRLGAQTSHACHILCFGLIVWHTTREARQWPTAENLILAAGGLIPLAGGTMLLLQWMAIMPMLIEPMSLFRAVLPATFILFLLACARSQRTLQDAEHHLAEARRSETEARLDALRHQLNPHFSFNALASIDALSREAPEKIPALVARLGAFLRHRMTPSGQPLNELGNEVEATRAYLDIEQARLEDRLETTYEVEPAALRALIPEFCLQPLAENALKYGLVDATAVRIRITARARDGRLRLTVANTGRIHGEHTVLRRGASIGLGNLRRRLALHHGEDARLDLSEADGWVTASLDIPFHEKTHP